jgi:hypothetical protein
MAAESRYATSPQYSYSLTCAVVTVWGYRVASSVVSAAVTGCQGAILVLSSSCDQARWNMLRLILATVQDLHCSQHRIVKRVEQVAFHNPVQLE